MSEIKHFGGNRGAIHPGLEGEDLATLVIRRNRLTILFWDLLFDALMRPSLIEVLDIGTKDTVQLLLLEDEQVIETLSTHTPQKPFTDRIGPWCMIRRFEDLNAAGCSHASETGSKLAITITNEIVRRLPIGSCLSQLLAVQVSVGDRVTPTWMTLRECISIMKKANSERKKRSVTCKKSHAHRSLAWFCRKVAHVCPRSSW